MPDFVLVCTVCGSEAVWDTEQLPPAGTPEVGHPVLWPCITCGTDQRHQITDICVNIEKLRHAVSMATEIDRRTVDRVLAAAEQVRRSQASRGGATEELAAVATAAGVPAETVDRIAVAEAAWLCRHGYLGERLGERR